MLQAIRSRAGSYVVKGLFALLILTFGIWGIGDIFRTRGADTVVATVGDQSIRAEELQTALRRALEQLSARFGSAVCSSSARMLWSPTVATTVSVPCVRKISPIPQIPKVRIWSANRTLTT